MGTADVLGPPLPVLREHCSRQLRVCRVLPPLCWPLTGLLGIWTCIDLSKRSGSTSVLTQGEEIRLSAV